MQRSEKKWFSVEIAADPGISDAVELALDLSGSVGIEIDSLGKKITDEISVVGYFDKVPEIERVRDKISEALNIYGFSEDRIRSVEAKSVEDRDWLAEWKKHWKPTEIGKFVVGPSWTEVDKSEKIVIKIEPNMAFGTGTHETTKLCLRSIQQNYVTGMSFLDVGTGTGILSIAVSKLAGNGPVKIVGCDTDADSVKIARENAEFNQTDGIEFYVGSIATDAPRFDFVCANVTADIIILLLPLLVEKSKRVLLLSGILVEQEQELRDELIKLGIGNCKTEREGEWISILTHRD